MCNRDYSGCTGHSESETTFSEKIDLVDGYCNWQETIQIATRPQKIINSAAEAGVESGGTTCNHILMVTLWVLFVKCKLEESLKKRSCASTVDSRGGSERSPDSISDTSTGQ